MMPQCPTFANTPAFQPRNTTVLRGTLQRSTNVMPNLYDACLYDEAALWDSAIAHGGLVRNCCPRGRKPYSQRPWVAMPEGGRRFQPIAILSVASLTPGTDTLIPFPQPFYVPIGFDGVITDVVMNVDPPAGSGTGFVEGSGDLVWRLSADGRYLRDLGNVLVQIGSLTNPSPTPRGGLRVYSHNLIQFFVNFSGNNVNTGCNIVCSIKGWHWPQ